MTARRADLLTVDILSFVQKDAKFQDEIILKGHKFSAFFDVMPHKEIADNCARDMSIPMQEAVSHTYSHEYMTYPVSNRESAKA
jgi:hypothetical protein